MLVSPNDIRVDAADRIREDVNDGIQPLCDSIRRLGQLQPILVDGDWNLIDGGRRLQACILLDRQVRIDIATDLEDAARKFEAQYEANECRLPFKPSEIAKFAKRLRAIKGPEAEQRMKAGKTPSEPSGNFPKGEDARTSNAIAKPFKISGKTLEKIESVVEAANDETLPEPVRETAKAAVKQMDETGKVDGAFKAVKAAKSGEPPTQKWEQGASQLPPDKDFSSADAESDTLFQLKRLWKRANKKDRKAFDEWRKSE